MCSGSQRDHHQHTTKPAMALLIMHTGPALLLLAVFGVPPGADLVVPAIVGVVDLVAQTNTLVCRPATVAPLP
jgi:hypothetical protein